MNITIDLERYEELIQSEYVAWTLLRDICERAKKYQGYSYDEVQMLRKLLTTDRCISFDDAREDA